MKVLYIGQYQKGSTSRMRAEKLKNLLNPESFEVINIDIFSIEKNSLFRSLGFRYKRGPLVNKVNSLIGQSLKGAYDLIWVDKGVYLRQETTQKLRQLTHKLVHFTPDPAFLFHQSKLFSASIPHYDFLITTKTFEVPEYEKIAGKGKVILITQGFDKEIHTPQLEFRNKKKGIIFIGHHEKERERLLRYLIERNIDVALAGIKWKKFARKNQNNKHLNYLGEGLFQEEYVKALSSYQFGLGLLSKWIPEKHTTRTFEVPACGTALLTEKNEETRLIFAEDEVIFFEETSDLVEKIKYFMNNVEKLENLTEKGYMKVKEGGYDYESILAKVIKQIGL